MKAFALVFLLVAALLAGCNDSSQSSPRPSSSSGGGVASAPADYVKSAAQSQKQAVKTIDLTALNKAVETFYIQEGRFPRALEELKEKSYLRVIPPPPPGMKVNYDSTNGIVTLEKE